MMARVAVLPGKIGRADPDLAWDEIGIVVEELSELVQTVKERRIDLILVDDSRIDISEAVATRLRRHGPLTDIWRFGPGRQNPDERETYIEGFVSTDQGQSGVTRKVEQILADKELLERYGIVGRSQAMRTVAQTIRRIAPTDVSVLIVGPSGAGKELVARALHQDSLRHNKPFVAINCGALAEGLLESELFGHERGAFTGSVAKREGLFRKAEGGTIFLDEIGETRPEMQVKLLRVLEDGTYYPVGSSTPLQADARVIAATNRDLTEAIAEKQFREDLYFRIGVVKIIVPPLFERRQDIQPLLHHFWTEKKGPAYSDAALDMLERYDWPGNVRQLRNFTARMAAFKPGGLVEKDDVERFLQEQHGGANTLPVSTGRTVEEAGQELIYRAILQLGTEVRMLRDLITSHLPNDVSGGDDVAVDITDSGRRMTMDDMEKTLIEKTLEETEGNRKEAAGRLGIGERTLYRKLKKYNLT
jgi:DNA-binding NtrC family response regulator